MIETSPKTAATVAEPKTLVSPPPSVRTRLDTVDLLRGLVMVLMALDHTRDFVFNGRVDPTDLAHTTAALFLTRWITHFCAPVFVFLAGVGAFLAFSRGKSRRELSRYLWTRGLWLIFLEFTLVHFGWGFDTDFLHFQMGQVIWAIGCSMIVLSGLVFLPLPVIGLFGVGMIATHNLFDGISPESWGALDWLWKILHAGGRVQIGGAAGPAPDGAAPSGFRFFALYPLIPWIGVMAAGYAFGPTLLLDPVRRRSLLLRLGAGLTVAFFVLRGVNVYGDPHPWTQQSSPLFTFFSFLNCQKYPPSLLYLLMTLGPALIALALFDHVPARLARPLITFGRVPLFYYLLHLPLLVLLALLGDLVIHGPGVLSAGPNAGNHGFPLPGVYLFWLAGLLILYPLCRWFAALKQRRRDAWLSYL